jgi:deazaflavin-dependent oxidoreductase (nitroreductase family)
MTLAGAARPSVLARVRAWVARWFVHPLARSRFFRAVGPKFVPVFDLVLHRISGGRLHSTRLFVDALVLTTTGRTSGEPRSAPLACLREADGSWLVVGSNFGKERHPAWTANLLAEPSATVDYRGETVTVDAALLDGAERDAAWRALRVSWPVYDHYEDVSGRSLRVFRLTPR